MDYKVTATDGTMEAATRHETPMEAFSAAREHEAAGRKVTIIAPTGETITTADLKQRIGVH